MSYQNNLNLQPRGITLPIPIAVQELKSHVMQMLSKFHDHIGEDPHIHVQNFEMVMMSQRVAGLMEEYIRLLSFPYTLEDEARDWVNALPPGEITT